MTTYKAQFICLAFIVIFTPAQVKCQEIDWNYHTTPDKWKEPRIYHEPFLNSYENYISIKHTKMVPDPKEKILSPNKAYWFSAQSRYGEKLERDGCNGIKIGAFTPDSPLFIYTERDYLIEIKPTKKDPDYFLMSVKWINEKLLYIELWWGRVLGSYYVFDVEKESILYKEMIRDGDIPFMQWQQMKIK